VAALRWVPVADLRAAIAADPRSYAPWLAGVVECLAERGNLDDAPERWGGR
jgi:isopentenyl-diphosphate Delta-isomerase